MNADVDYRADEFTRLYTINWDIWWSNDLDSFWAEAAYGLAEAADRVEDGEEALLGIMSVDLGERGALFTHIVNMEDDTY